MPKLGKAEIDTVLGIYEEARGLPCLAEYLLSTRNQYTPTRSALTRIWIQHDRQPAKFSEVLENFVREVYDECGGNSFQITTKVRQLLPHYAIGVESIESKMKNNWHLPIRKIEVRAAASANSVKRAGIKPIKGYSYLPAPEAIG